MKKASFTILSFLTFTFFTFGITSAQSDPARTLSESEKAVRKLERTWLDAYEQRNVESMNAIVADDFTITFPDGSIQTKPQIIASLKSPAATAMKFTTENVQSSRLRRHGHPHRYCRLGMETKRQTDDRPIAIHRHICPARRPVAGGCISPVKRGKIETCAN